VLEKEYKVFLMVCAPNPNFPSKKGPYYLEKKPNPPNFRQNVRFAFLLSFLVEAMRVSNLDASKINSK